nr:hypothetical protein [uncultured Celeribacter sp.]
MRLDISAQSTEKTLSRDTEARKLSGTGNTGPHEKSQAAYFFLLFLSSFTFHARDAALLQRNNRKEPKRLGATQARVQTSGQRISIPMYTALSKAMEMRYESRDSPQSS